MQSMIDWISPRPVDDFSSFGDIFEGHHRVAGKVSLKRLKGGKLADFAVLEVWFFICDLVLQV